MITCEHCGSPLPDGAIFCGECGRAVTGSARRAAAPEQASAPTPPPLQSPGPHGVRRDPASEAWLPESTLDPATRAWLTGDRAALDSGPASVPIERPTEEYSPRTAPTHVHGSGTGLGNWTGRVPSEPPLDPDAFPVSAPSGGTSMQPRREPLSDLEVDTEATVVADRAGTAEPAHAEPAPAEASAPPAHSAPAQSGPPAPSAHEDTAPVWGGSSAVPAQPAPATTPAAPSWWIDRGPSASTESVADETPTNSRAAESPVATPTTAATMPSTDRPGEPDVDTQGAAEPHRAVPSHDAPDGSAAHPAPRDVSTAGADADSAPRPGDTAIVPRIETQRQAPRPAPLVAPGVHGATCHVCGHTLEPDDIFCEECGAVVPAVTAAYTGPVTPLPMARPDWSVTDADAGPGEPRESSAEPNEEARGASATDVPSVPPLPGGAAPSARERLAAWAGRRAPAVETPVVAEPGPEHEPAPEPEQEPAPEPERAPTSSSSSSAPAEPHAEPAPVVGSVSAPVPTSAEELDAADELEDVDATRIVSRAPQRAPVILHFSTGERVGVQGSGLVGRLPRPAAGERVDDLVTIVDPGKSVSKTHLELGRDGDDLWVSDRNSGNGTVVRHIDGSIRRCEPGRRYRVERGARVDIGEQFFLVQ